MITWETFKPEIEKAIEMRRKGKVDGNQTKVVEALRKAGLSVAITSSLGNGFPDLVVSGLTIKNDKPSPLGKTHTAIIRTVLIELKAPSQPPSGRKLTDDEKKFHDSWKGEVYVCTTAEEILCIFGLI